MYSKTMLDMTSQEVNDSVRIFFQEEPYSEYLVCFKLNQVLIDTGITQKELSIRTGIREATISSYRRGTIKNISLPILIRIMIELNITDIRDLISLEY